MGVAVLLSAVLPAPGPAQQPPPDSAPAAAKSLQDLAKDHHNPFGDTVKLPFTLTAGVGGDPAITHDWTADPADAWSIPLGLDTGRPFRIGEHSVGLQLGAYWFVEHPENTPEWIVRVQVTFQFSSRR